MTWDWDYALQILPLLIQGAGLTIVVTFASAAIALGGGLLLTIATNDSPRFVTWLLRVFVETFRGVPILVLLYFGFYVLPQVGIMFSPLVVGILVLGIVYAAYCSEVYRGGIAEIPNSIHDACQALGLKRSVQWRRVLMPIAIRSVTPSLMNYVLLLYKQSSFLFAIGVPVLLGQAQMAGYNNFKYLEPYTMAAVIYLLLNLPFIFALHKLEVRNER